MPCPAPRFTFLTVVVIMQHSAMTQQTIKPRSWLFDLFGDYVEHRDRELWTGSIIALGAEFDLSERALRSALLRLQRDGWIRVRRAGTRSYYGLTNAGRD